MDEMEPQKECLLTLVKATWEAEYVANNLQPRPRSQDNEHSVKRQKQERSPDLFDRHIQSVYQDSVTAAGESEGNFNAYINSARSRGVDVPNIIQWWAEKQPSPLVQLALNVLSILVMSTECEHLFSSASNLVGTARFSLHDETMEALELL